MADADHQDPGGSSDDLDLKAFYRDNPDAAPPKRTTQSIDIKDYLRPEDAGEQASQSAPASSPEQLAHSLYSPPQYHPADAAAALAKGESGGAPEQPETPPAIAPAANDAAGVAAEQAQGPDPNQPHPADAYEGNAEALPPAPPLAGSNPIVRFAAIGALLGVGVGVIAIGFSWMTRKPPEPYDLGTSTSTAVGLRGHLFTKWDDDKLQYRVTFEPADKDLHRAFALAVSNPPHPLSIGIQLKDAMGFVLCTREIALRYDSAAAAAQQSPAVDMAQLAAQEKQREQGKDMFQSQPGADGLVQSISAQGQMPCSDAAYSKAVAWGFTPDFPTLAEQNDQVKQEVEKQATIERAVAARKHPQAKAPEKTLVFSIEGDESIVGYDPSAGMFETNSDVSFLVDKDNGQANLAAWQQFPIRVHYHCDQTSYCTLMRTGGGAPLRARLHR